MALWIDQMRDKRDGSPLNGAFIRTKTGHCVIIATLDGAVFKPCAPRYERDRDLIAAARRLMAQAKTELTPIPTHGGHRAT